MIPSIASMIPFHKRLGRVLCPNILHAILCQTPQSFPSQICSAPVSDENCGIFVPSYVENFLFVIQKLRTFTESPMQTHWLTSGFVIHFGQSNARAGDQSAVARCELGPTTIQIGWSLMEMERFLGL